MIGIFYFMDMIWSTGKAYWTWNFWWYNLSHPFSETYMSLHVSSTEFMMKFFASILKEQWKYLGEFYWCGDDTGCFYPTVPLPCLSTPLAHAIEYLQPPKSEGGFILVSCCLSFSWAPKLMGFEVWHSVATHPIQMSQEPAEFRAPSESFTSLPVSTAPQPPLWFCTWVLWLHLGKGAATPVVSPSSPSCFTEKAV